MNAKDFWHQYEIAKKAHDKWEKRADKVLKRYRMDEETEVAKPSFNILWANVSVQHPSLFSQVPKPDIRRRYRDDDALAKEGAKILERALEFVMDDGDFYTFGNQSVMDYLLPGRACAKIRYVPLFAKTRKPALVEGRAILSPFGEEVGMKYFLDDEEVDPAEVKFQKNVAYIEQEVEEVVDEHVVIERWPWKNYIHQKAKRWQDVGWVDYISFMNREQLVKHFGKKKGNEVELSVDASGGQDKQDNAFKPTHAEIHEVWFKATREVKVGCKDDDYWLDERDDPLRLNDFFPGPAPLLAINTNDSLMPIPLFTLYQHQANELDNITRRITILMKALKLAGLYAGNEKETLKKLFESDENQMIPVADWGAIQAAGGISGLVDWLPIEQVGKVLGALFRERESLIQQIYELTGIADIQRGATDPRETRGAQVLKAQFSDRRTLTPKQMVEIYFRDCLRISAEIMAEHFSVDTLQRMTGLQVPEQVKKLLEDELTRQYRIDIETDSTIAPDEQAEQANMAKALEAITAYVGTIGPMVMSGDISKEASLKLLKVYLRKFKWGREMEEVIEELERQPQQPKPDPEQQKMQMEMQMEQQRMQGEMQQMQAELQMKAQETQMKLQEMQAKMQLDMQKARMEMQQDQQIHMQEMRQDQEMHAQDIEQSKQMGAAKVEVTKAMAKAKPKNGANA